MDNWDSLRIEQIEDNTEKMADAFTRIADALEKLANKPEPRTSQIINAYTPARSCGSSSSLEVGND